MTIAQKVQEETKYLIGEAYKKLHNSADSYITSRENKQWKLKVRQGIMEENFYSDTELGVLHKALKAISEPTPILQNDVEEVRYEMIDHPKHYGGKESKHEAISVIEEWNLGFHLGNVVKYISRAGRKPDQSQIDDLKKAQWYLERYIEKLED